jgi:hypothetical protein
LRLALNPVVTHSSRCIQGLSNLLISDLCQIAGFGTRRGSAGLLSAANFCRPRPLDKAILARRYEACLIVIQRILAL